MGERGAAELRDGRQKTGIGKAALCDGGQKIEDGSEEA